MSNPDRQAPESGGLYEALGVEFIELQTERVVAKMQTTSRHRHHSDYLHNGVCSALAETVASTASSSNCPPDTAALSVEINTTQLGIKPSDALTAVATPLHVSPHSHTWEVRIHDDTERLICVSQCTLAIVENEKNEMTT